MFKRLTCNVFLFMFNKIMILLVERRLKIPTQPLTNQLGYQHFISSFLIVGLEFEVMTYL